MTATSGHTWIEVLSVFAAFVLAAYAIRRDSRALGLIAALIGSTVVAGILLWGWFAFPLLFWFWLKQPKKGVGWILLASMVLSTLLLFWRIPWPRPPIEGPQRMATATVQRTQVVTRLWPIEGDEDGEPLRLPFDVVSIQFAVAGTNARINAVDTIDHGSVAGLRDNASVRVVYSPFDPQSARIASAAREYARDAFVYFLELTYGIAGALIVAGVIVRWLIKRLFTGRRPNQSVEHA